MVTGQGEGEGNYRSAERGCNVAHNCYGSNEPEVYVQEALEGEVWKEFYKKIPVANITGLHPTIMLKCTSCITVPLHVMP